MLDFSITLLIGVAAGVLNALGGGGTFVALPVLVAMGMPPVTANAVSRIALVPGALAGVWVYRREMKPVGPVSIKQLTVVSIVGSTVGASLLLVLPATSFKVLSPWLLAFATLVLAFGRPVSQTVSKWLGHDTDMSSRTLLIGQFFIAVYGGYFGGALGILMVALWSVGVGIDVSAANPMRMTQLAAVFFISGVLFLFISDALRTPLLLVILLVGATVGGYVGAHIARKLSPRLMRGVLLTTATAMTLFYVVGG